MEYLYGQLGTSMESDGGAARISRSSYKSPPAASSMYPRRLRAMVVAVSIPSTQAPSYQRQRQMEPIGQSPLVIQIT